jgi:hypothetical protein
VVATAGTVWEPVGEELVIWNGEDRTLHRLDWVGRWLWDRLEGGVTIAEAADAAAQAVGEEDAVRARQDVVGFIQSLEQRGLVRLVPLSEAASHPRGDGQ